MFLCVLNPEKYTAISWISHKVVLIDPNKPPQLRKPPLNTQRHHPTCLSYLYIYYGPPKSVGAIDNKKLHVHLRHCPTPNLLLWWCCEPPITFYA